MRSFLLALLLLLSTSTQAKDIEANRVLLRGVDKVTGRTQTAEAEIGVPLTLANLRITAQRCLKKPPEETPENAAFLVIEEKNKNDVYEVAFNGWMFSSNPALSAMEDPIYDIWVLDCLSDEATAHVWDEMVPVAVPVVQKKQIEVDSLADLDSEISIGNLPQIPSDSLSENPVLGKDESHADNQLTYPDTSSAHVSEKSPQQALSHSSLDVGDHVEQESVNVSEREISQLSRRQGDGEAAVNNLNQEDSQRQKVASENNLQQEDFLRQKVDAAETGEGVTGLQNEKNQNKTNQQTQEQNLAPTLDKIHKKSVNPVSEYQKVSGNDLPNLY